MREILFRGKRKDNGEWIYGFLYCFYDFKRKVVQILRDRTNGIPDEVEVIPETVGQYTGLTDKNGTKIFEGDILLIEWKVAGRTPVHEKHIVMYSKSGFFTESNGQLKGQVSNYACSNCSGLSVEVIGNIHDNPELLEVK